MRNNLLATIRLKKMQQVVEKVVFPGWSKTSRCKARKSRSFVHCESHETGQQLLSVSIRNYEVDFTEFNNSFSNAALQLTKPDAS